MINLLFKLHTHIRKHGLFGFTDLVMRTVRARLRAFLSGRVRRRDVRQSIAGDYDRIILWRSGFGFYAPLYQRPQQMARALARQRCLMLYEANPLTDRVDGLKELETNLVLVNWQSPLLRRSLLRELAHVQKPKYLQLYSANRELSLRELQAFVRRGWHVLYEYVDALSPAISGTARLPKAVADKYFYAMTHPEVTVVATAERLRKAVVRRRGAENLILASNGVDYAFFQQWDPYEFEPAFRAILARGRPIVCYYGALAEWIDYELLRTLAGAGRYSVVLIGVKYDASFDRELRGTAAVDYLGPRDYRVLKYYARAAGVLILPFLINEITRATNPVKLFEYMALQRPIVSTDIDECRRYRGVLIGKTQPDFLRQVERALSLRDDKDYLALLDGEARANDWREKANTVVEALKKQEKLPEA